MLDVQICARDFCKLSRAFEGCPHCLITGAVQERGSQEQDAAERLAGALRRIAVGIERREALAAAAQAALDAAARVQAAIPQSPAAQEGADLNALAAHLDAMIARLRGALSEHGLAGNGEG